MIYLGAEAAARVAKRSHYELLAQGVSEVIPMYRDSAGGCYFAKADLPGLPRRTVCVVRNCGRPRHAVRVCLCQTHYRRWRDELGRGLSEGVNANLVRRGSGRVVRSDRDKAHREPMRSVSRDDPELVEMMCRSGHVTTDGRPWNGSDRHADQLGTPEMWQEVADAALERAWADLLDGSYEKRLQGRLAARRPARPTVIQSPILAVVS